MEQEFSFQCITTGGWEALKGIKVMKNNFVTMRRDPDNEYGNICE